MSRDTLVFSLCSFLLGLTIGSLLIGPHLARGTAAATPAQTASNPMTQVRDQLAQLNATLERDPKNFDALTQLGGMYMMAAKFPQAIDYFERALAVRDDAEVRSDLATCYYDQALSLAQEKRLDEARALLPRLEQLKPGDPDVQRLRDALR
ncbi:MAG TPA: tetratricopeptide repeat protein [Thermoanaerobaculia bacterium]|nr:tetratricopeptide repeat protein [Thermoanaerobaculia bacterium]